MNVYTMNAPLVLAYGILDRFSQHPSMTLWLIKVSRQSLDEPLSMLAGMIAFNGKTATLMYLERLREGERRQRIHSLIKLNVEAAVLSGDDNFLRWAIYVERTYGDSDVSTT